MTYVGAECMDVEDHILSSRLSDFLHDQYPSDRSKRLARDIGCEPRTAKNILNRHWPSARHLRAIIQRFGTDVIDAVFTVEVEPVVARLTAEERRLEEQLAQAQARRRQAQGGRDGVPGRVVTAAGGVHPRRLTAVRQTGGR